MLKVGFKSGSDRHRTCSMAPLGNHVQPLHYTSKRKTDNVTLSSQDLETFSRDGSWQIASFPEYILLYFRCRWIARAILISGTLITQRLS